MPQMLALYQQRPGETANAASKYGDLDAFKVGPFDAPIPPPAPTDVHIRVHAAALNPIDIKRGAAFDTHFPVLVGYDVSGIVTAVGAAAATAFRVGDRVFGDVLASSLGPKHTGSAAEHVSAPADVLMKVPPTVSFVDAAAVPLVAMTALQMLRQAGVHDGATIFISAGAGGVAIHFMQITKKLFDVACIATTASPGKTELVKKFGADKVIDYRSQDAGEVLAGWADFVFDMTGDAEQARKIVKKDGVAISIVAPADGVQMCLVQPNKEDMQTVANMLADGSLTAVIDSEYDLKDGVEAIKRQASGRASGKVILRVA